MPGCFLSFTRTLLLDPYTILAFTTQFLVALNFFHKMLGSSRNAYLNSVLKLSRVRDRDLKSVRSEIAILA